MDKNRLWLIASVLVMALVLVGGWFVGVQPQLAGIADSEAQTAAVEATNEQNARVVAQLKKDSENLPALKAKLAELAASVPQGSDIPPFVDQLNALYSSSGVVCVDQAFADAVAYAPVVAPAASAPAPGAASTATPTPAPTAPPTQAPTAGVPPVVSSLITASNFAAQPVTITVRGQYANVLQFVNGLQTGARLFLVTGLSTAPTTGTDAVPGSVDGKVTGYIYSLTSAAALNAQQSQSGNSAGTSAEASK